MYVDLGTGVRRSKDVPRIAYVLKSALVPDLGTVIVLVSSGIDSENTPRLYSDRATC